MSAAPEVLKALSTRYTALTFTPKPTAYLYYLPLRDSSGVAITAPAVVISAEDGPSEPIGNMHRKETVRVTVTVYDITDHAAKLVMKGIQYDGGTPANRGGFDFASSLTLATGYRLDLMEPTNPGTLARSSMPNTDATPVWEGRLTYNVSVLIDPSATI